MEIAEPGVLAQSQRYFFTPTAFAERMLYYPTRIGHYFCDMRYCFSCQSHIARQAGHRLHFMLFVVTQGQLQLQIDACSYTANAGQVVLFDCQKPHDYRATTDTAFDWMLFNGAQSNVFFAELLARQGGKHVWSTPAVTELQDIFGQLLHACQTNRHLPETRSSALIYQALCHLLAAEPTATHAVQHIIEHAAAYIDIHYATVLTVQDLATRFHLSSSHFTKCFRAQMGCSPYEYIILCRINRAKVLLATSDKTIKQIAYEVGYQSEENFVRSFHKKVGLSPSIFRHYPI